MAQNAVRRFEVEESNESVLTEEQIQYLVLTHRDNGRKVARSLLRRWRVTMPVEEVDSIVDLTLCEAARRYNPEKGASFVTFLFYHLRGHLVRAVASATNESNIFLALLNANGAERASVVVDAEAWQFASELVPSLSRESECPESLLLQKERVSLCRAACSELDELEREVIERSYANDEALIDIADSLGYSRCHISRVKKRALSRLKRHIRSANAELGAEAENQISRRNRRRRMVGQKAA